MPLAVEVGLSPGDFVLDGDPYPFHKKGRSPQFSAPRLKRSNCGQTAAWIKMPLCTDRPRPVRIVLDGDSPSPKGAQPPVFGQFPLWRNG